MKIIIASDKFKGSLSANEACQAIAKGIKEALPGVEVAEFPMADGGEGTAEILAVASHGRMIECKVHDPLFRIINARFGLSGDGQTAFIEMALASGLQLLQPEERNCYHTTSLGTGELIMEAVNAGVKKIILCIGGSATNDGGTGMASAIGYNFMDKTGNVLDPVGRNLKKIAHIDDSRIDKCIRKIQFEIACDVDNPLHGKNGAAFVYGPQKGANPEELKKLDTGLANLASVIRMEMKKEIENIPGAGAAGGMGGGAVAFLDARLKRGIDVVMDYIKFSDQLKKCQLVITGEGKMDEQTLKGKVILGIVQRTKKFNIPVIALAGIIELSPEQISNLGLSHAVSIMNEHVDKEEAMANAALHLYHASKNLAPVIKTLIH